jgi:ABC-type transport system involved in multi-copper enzyme maturation permease subunit
MIKEIFIKELREHIASTTMIVVFTIIILLFLANSIAFLKKYSSHALQYQQMNLALYDDLKDSSGSLLELTFTDYDLIYPPSIFGFMADGSQNLLPNGIQLDFFHISTPKLYQQADNYIFDTMELDWNNILVFLISFVCIFFSYNSFSGEKKQGTLKLIISNQVSRAQIVLGKYLGVCCLILLPFIVGVIITIVVLRFSSAIHITYHHYAIVLYYILASIIHSKTPPFLKLPN